MTSYDDIVRRTVPNPDSSFRPSREQVEIAQRAPADRPALAMSDDEQALHARVVAALRADPAVVANGVRVDVERTRVILSGGVAGPEMVQRVEQIAAAIDGVTDVENHLAPVPPAHA